MFVAYYRVSTDKQGQSGLGLEAQQAQVQAFLRQDPEERFIEVESGAKSNRPQLKQALALCKEKKATLIVAKLDRLARDVKLILSIVDSGVSVRFVDIPEVDTSTPMGRFMLTMLASLAELERRIISQRTKAALEAKKARGHRLGSPDPSKGIEASIKAKQEMSSQFVAEVMPRIQSIQAAGYKTSRDIADQLTLQRVPTFRAWKKGEIEATPRWGHGQVCEILRRAA